MEPAWRIIDAQLAGRDYLAGAFSLADIVMGPYLHRWFALPIDRAELKNLRAWYDRLHDKHPGFAKHVAVELT